MSDSEVEGTLRALRSGGDVDRLHQYIAVIVSPTGWTLREVGEALGCSYQRAAQLRNKGLRKRALSPLDLSNMPTPDERPARVVRQGALTGTVAERLRRLNRHAKGFRRGADPKAPLKFYALVANLHEQGFTYAEIARTLGENERQFVKRLARWGVTEGRHGQSLNVSATKEGSDQ